LHKQSTQSPNAIAIRPFAAELKTSAGGIIAAKTIDTKNAVGKLWRRNLLAITSVIVGRKKATLPTIHLILGDRIRYDT
jgi:hypothetical protein